ncbi:hypothetical protein [Stieleria varia]|uniref:Uncharacterized protein n=1 Tax=Stieleria varia TaxID=2528005 RepID=A0A5C6B5J8_9BACT|nr:hypothetical protein [Stieleria varia]TWU05764.1 hypothetical protein Pla52n_14790 [Stieleria varia]
MNHRIPIQRIAAMCYLCIVFVFGPGCTKPKQTASTRSAQARQDLADAERAEELKFQDEEGNTDWRARLEAAKEALEEAQSEKRWGNKTAALEKALDAARLMPPPGKDFELPQLSSSGQGDGESGDGESDGSQAAAEAGDSDAETNQGLSNEEVQQLRDSLSELLESLDGRVGATKADLSLDHDIIEIE